MLSPFATTGGPLADAASLATVLTAVEGIGPAAVLGALAGAIPVGLLGVDPADFELRLLLIPPITGIIGYMTNWVAIRLMFHPTEFRGVDVPGLEKVTQLMPYRIQQIPGMLEGKVGWQGIIPSRAGKMGSISVDTAISKFAEPREYYERFDPDEIAEHIIETMDDDVNDLVDEIIQREHPELWADTPPAFKRLVHRRVEQQLPEITREITHQIGENIEELLDIKRMVIDYLEENPDLLNRMFLETGGREFEFLVNSGFYLGTLLGCFSIPLFVLINEWWVLPLAGVFVGYFTNFIALKAIFRPIQPHDVGPFNLQGLFIKRQDEASETYAKLVAENVITLSNVAENLLYGPNSDRTRQLIQKSMRPAVDDAVGQAEPFVRVMTGSEEYDAIRESFANEAVEHTIGPLQDPEFNRERGEAMEQLISERMKNLPPSEFTELLRSAFKEDEWLLIATGAALGFVAGWVQLGVVNAV